MYFANILDPSSTPRMITAFTENRDTPGAMFGIDFGDGGAR